jgi:hypothetical protein
MRWQIVHDDDVAGGEFWGKDLRAGRSEEGCRHRGSQRLGSTALVEVE